MLSRSDFFHLLSQGFLTKELTIIRKDLYELDEPNFENFLEYVFGQVFYSE